MPVRVAFMPMFAGWDAFELLVFLPANLPESCICSTVNLRFDLSRRISSGNMYTQGIGRPAPYTDLTFKKFGSFSFHSFVLHFIGQPQTSFVKTDILRIKASKGSSQDCLNAYWQPEIK